MNKYARISLFAIASLLSVAPSFLSSQSRGMGGTILLYNDASFILTATIQASDGTFLGQFSIQPGQQKNFTQNLFTTQYNTPGTPDVSLTPYTVVWQCPSEGFYSMCADVSPGALIRANSCPGTRFCKPKQPPPTETPASKLETSKKS